VVGWNVIGEQAIRHLNRFMTPESTLIVLADAALMGASERASLEAAPHVTPVLVNSSRDVMATIRSHVAHDEPTAIAILPYRELLSPSESDAETLVTLTSVRAVIGERPIRVISELRETRSAQLVQLPRIAPDDLILSDKLAAWTMAQIADRPFVNDVLADLLDGTNSMLSIEPLTDDATDGSTTYQMLRRAALAEGKLVVGVRRTDGRVELNPDANHIVDPAHIDGVIMVTAGSNWTQHHVPSRISDILE
jgi:hypothetical protein